MRHAREGTTRAREGGRSIRDPLTAGSGHERNPISLENPWLLSVRGGAGGGALHAGVLRQQTDNRHSSCPLGQYQNQSWLAGWLWALHMAPCAPESPSAGRRHTIRSCMGKPGTIARFRVKPSLFASVVPDRVAHVGIRTLAGHLRPQAGRVSGLCRRGPTTGGHILQGSSGNPVTERQSLATAVFLPGEESGNLFCRTAGASPHDVQSNSSGARRWLPSGFGPVRTSQGRPRGATPLPSWTTFLSNIGVRSNSDTVTAVDFGPMQKRA